jgi:hypothetical protein
MNAVAILANNRRRHCSAILFPVDTLRGLMRLTFARSTATAMRSDQPYLCAVLPLTPPNSCAYAPASYRRVDS